jgi:nucleotide-binding universal stress UspA family protein
MSRSTRTILAGIGSLDADITLEAALSLAARLDATLHVVHAFSLPQPIREPYSRRLGLAPEMLGRRGGQLRSEMEARLGSLPGGERAVCHAVHGSAGESMARVAGEVEPGFVIVGASRAARAGGSFLGSTAEQVVRHASVPVLVLRRTPDVERRRLLLTTDLSPAGVERCRSAVDLATELFGAEPEVRTLLVVEYDPEGWLTLNPDVLRSIAEEELASFAADVGEPVAGELRTRFGRPADEILHEARDWGADLLVLGTQSGGGPVRRLLGSVARSALGGAQCNVLVVPRGPEPPDPPGLRIRLAGAAAS